MNSKHISVYRIVYIYMLKIMEFVILNLRPLKLDVEFPVARPRYEFWAAFATENLKIIHYFEKIVLKHRFRHLFSRFKKFCLVFTSPKLA